MYLIIVSKLITPFFYWTRIIIIKKIQDVNCFSKDPWRWNTIKSRNKVDLNNTVALKSHGSFTEFCGERTKHSPDMATDAQVLQYISKKIKLCKEVVRTGLPIVALVRGNNEKVMECKRNERSKCTHSEQQVDVREQQRRRSATPRHGSEAHTLTHTGLRCRNENSRETTRADTGARCYPTCAVPILLLIFFLETSCILSDVINV